MRSFPSASLPTSFSLPLFFLALVLPSSSLGSSLASSSQSQAEAILPESELFLWMNLVLYILWDGIQRRRWDLSLTPHHLLQAGRNGQRRGNKKSLLKNFLTQRRRRDKTPLILSRQQFLACVVICSWRLLPTVSLHPCYCCWSSCLLLTLCENISSSTSSFFFRERLFFYSSKNCFFFRLFSLTLKSRVLQLKVATRVFEDTHVFDSSFKFQEED